MKMRSLLLAMVLTASVASPVLAAEPETTVASETNRAQEQAPTASTLQRLCLRDVPTMDYRACINSSTRDKNAKVRQA